MFYDNNIDYGNEFRNYWNDHVKKFRAGGFVAGIIMIVLGVLCFIFPVNSLLVMEILIAILIITAGAGEIAAYSRMPVFLRLPGTLISGILNILLGVLLLVGDRQEMMITFAFIFSIELIVVGIQEIAASNRMRFFGETSTGWLVASGALNLIGGCCLLFMPAASIAISFVVAIYLVVGGVSLLVKAVNAKELKM